MLCCAATKTELPTVMPVDGPTACRVLGGKHNDYAFDATEVARAGVRGPAVAQEAVAGSAGSTQPAAHRRLGTLPELDPAPPGTYLSHADSELQSAVQG